MSDPSQYDTDMRFLRNPPWVCGLQRLAQEHLETQDRRLTATYHRRVPKSHRQESSCRYLLRHLDCCVRNRASSSRAPVRHWVRRARLSFVCTEQVVALQSCRDILGNFSSSPWRAVSPY